MDLIQLAQRVRRRTMRLRVDPTVHGAERYYGGIYLEHIRGAIGSLGSGLRVLDVGCGAGRFVLPLAADGHRVTGVEYHADSARVARMHLVEQNLRAEIVDADARAYVAGLESASFDAALALEMLYVNPEPGQMLRELGRVVRPGGVLLAAHRTRFYYIASALARGRFDDAELVLCAAEGKLSKGMHRVYYNWHSAHELPELYKAAGLELRAMHAIGPYSGFEPDPLSRICDPTGMSDHDRERLRRIETAPNPDALATARYILTVSRPGL